MPSFTTRGTTDGSLSVDVRFLAREGMLSPGHRGSLAWRSAGKEIASIGIEADFNSVRFRYTSQGRSVDLPISLDHTQPGYMPGWRQWFLCPECGRRCALLYAPRFACRICLDLRYESQRSGRRFQPIKRAARVLAKLGGQSTLPPRPKGMWQSTYDNLCREYAGGLQAFAGSVLG